MKKRTIPPRVRIETNPRQSRKKYQEDYTTTESTHATYDMENLHGGFAYVSYAYTTTGHDDKEGTRPSAQHATNTGSTARRMPVSSICGTNDNTRHSPGMDMTGTIASCSYSTSTMTARSRTGNTAWNPDAGSMKLTSS